jgi:hypothetical protein
MSNKVQYAKIGCFCGDDALFITHDDRPQRFFCVSSAVNAYRLGIPLIVIGTGKLVTSIHEITNFIPKTDKKGQYEIF